MAVNENDLAFALEQLSGLDPIQTKRMFGGVGIFKEGLMFAMVSSDNVFRLKVDDSNKADFLAQSMEPLYHKNDRTKRAMDYYQVPVSVLENEALMTKWAQKSFEIAVKKKRK